MAGVRPHDYLQIEFPAPRRIDEVVLECDPYWDARIQVDVRLESGRWVPLTDTPEYEKAGPPEGIRRAAARDVKLLGFRYLLLNEADMVYEDFQKNRHYWGVTELANVNGTHLYRID